MAKKIGEREESFFVYMNDLVFVDVSYLEKYIFLKDDGTSSSKPYISKHMKMLEREGYVKSFPLAKEGERKEPACLYARYERCP